MDRATTAEDSVQCNRQSLDACKGMSISAAPAQDHLHMKSRLLAAQCAFNLELAMHISSFFPVEWHLDRHAYKLLYQASGIV